MRRQSSIEAAFSVKMDQEKALKLYYNFFISSIVPAHITDSEHLREFLCYAVPDFSVPSRRKLSRDIGQLGEEAKGKLIDIEMLPRVDGCEVCQEGARGASDFHYCSDGHRHTIQQIVVYYNMILLKRQTWTCINAGGGQ
jgi:hypothetical protein